MSPVGIPSKRYSENNPTHVPAPTDLRGTFETSGTSGPGTQYNYDDVVDIFKTGPDADRVTRGGTEGDAEVEQEHVEPEVEDGEDASVVAAEDDTSRTAPMPGNIDTTGAGVSVNVGAEQMPTEAPEVEGDDEAPEEVAEETPEDDEVDEGDEEKYQDDPDFTPVGRTISVVDAYLAKASPAERARVIDLEKETSGRRGIVEGPYAS